MFKILHQSVKKASFTSRIKYVSLKLMHNSGELLDTQPKNPSGLAPRSVNWHIEKAEEPK
jgi:hypothetical protein